jgi:hypothetical protein
VDAAVAAAAKRLPPSSSSSPASLVWELTLGRNDERYHHADGKGMGGQEASSPAQPATSRRAQTAASGTPPPLHSGATTDDVTAIMGSEARGLLMHWAESLFETSIAQGWTNGHTYLGDLYFADAAAQQAQTRAERERERKQLASKQKEPNSETEDDADDAVVVGTTTAVGAAATAVGAVGAVARVGQLDLDVLHDEL